MNSNDFIHSLVYHILSYKITVTFCMISHEHKKLYKNYRTGQDGLEVLNGMNCKCKAVDLSSSTIIILVPSAPESSY